MDKLFIGPKGFETIFDDLSNEALIYLADYGLKKSLADSIAGQKKALEEARITEEDVKEHPSIYRPVDIGVLKYSPSEIAVILGDIQTKRYRAILSGTIGISGPKLRGIDKVIDQIARELIRDKAAQKRKPLPKGEAYDTLLAKVKEANADYLRSEAEKRLATHKDVEIEI